MHKLVTCYGGPVDRQTVAVEPFVHSIVVPQSVYSTVPLFTSDELVHEPRYTHAIYHVLADIGIFMGVFPRP